MQSLHIDVYKITLDSGSLSKVLAGPTPWPVLRLRRATAEYVYEYGQGGLPSKTPLSPRIPR